ncbi:winged helix DNA-binding domain-containing protein [Streptomyces purpureus]|uniref:winged helix DNA-binding domain-containing protein n=1 Tax=Streptomyces purpureus TaxID=1951 RepID=UPI00048F43F4|nr:winged helix DNA-binding domain-containing protein [Streptomyces purpureus]
MGAARRLIEDGERRRRVGVRHRLASGAREPSVEDVAEALVALHATDAATVFLAVGARLQDSRGTVAAVERALYEERTLARMHGMRHTLFVFPVGIAPVVQASTTHAVAVRERAVFLKHLAAAGGFDAHWLEQTERETLSALAARGEATAVQLGSDVPRLREKLVYEAGTAREVTQSVSTRLLRTLGTEGRVMRGRPLGSWTSSQFRWAIAPPMPELPAADAQSELVRHWLATCGPATEADLKWWTGWKVTDVRKALAAIGAEAVGLEDGTTGFVLAGDTEEAPEPEPWAALLPALDPTAMGWQQRDWFLDPDHRAELFDRSGNIGPTVWWNGRVIGGWAQRAADGEIVWHLFAPQGREVLDAIEAEAGRLASWLGGARITPRFRTPLERRLTQL